MTKILQNVFLLFILLSYSLLFSQKEKQDMFSDSLKNKSYKELYDAYFITKKINPEKASLYALTYLQKAKKEGDKRSIAKGYKYVGTTQSGEVHIKYLDSAIVTLEQGLMTKMLVGFYYFDKANILYKKRDFRKTIDNLLITNKEARKYNYANLIFSSNYMIALLTDRIGNHNDAIKILKEYPNYIKDKNITKIDTSLYLNTHFALSIASYKLKRIDSASYYNNIGIIESLKGQKLGYYNRFVLASGVIFYLKNEYERALDSIKKSITYFEDHSDKPNLGVSYFYRGKILYESNQKAKGVASLKKLDTIFQEQNDILPEAREGYEILIQYFKENNDLKQQLLYTERLITVDKVLNQNYRHLQTNIIKDYYTPLLLDKKIEEENQSFWKIIYSILFFLIISLIGLLYSYNRQYIYKKKFNILLNKGLSENKNTLQNSKTNNYQEISLGRLNISDEIVTSIFNGLKIFEDDKKFLKPKYTLNTLAKELKTNSSYLSKVINVTKNKNFSNYINDLRINFAINELKNNNQFRLYSIKGIAQEVGFKNSESFSKAFYKRTGIYPSYFIKELNKK